MPEFFETRMGQEFYLKSVPKLIKEIGRVADALEGKSVLPSVNNSTILCQKIDEKVFADILNKVSNGDVMVGYFHKCIPNFRSKKLNREITFSEIVSVMKEILKDILGKEVKDIEQITARNGFVYIVFTAE